MKIKGLFFSLFYVSISFCQFGPAGVGGATNNGLWLKSGIISGLDGDNVSNWNDQSGNTNDALQTDVDQQPLFFSSSAINNQPVVRFDGINDQMRVLDADILDDAAGLTYFAVLRPNNLNNQPRGILGKRLTFTVSVKNA